MLSVKVYGWLTVLFGGLFVVFLASIAYGASRLAAERVVRVVDGDTIVLNRGGKLVTCRLIGCNTPETVHPKLGAEPYGKEASDYVRGWLEGKTVRVDYEYPAVDGKYRTDRYGRLLVYLYADQGRQLVNLELVARGFARFDGAYRTRFREDFKRAEANAKLMKLGLWGLQPEPKAKGTSWLNGRFRVPFAGRLASMLTPN